MADKSFGDHTNRGVVKNPLLSNVVTGLSLDDLTQKAVLLPVSPTSGVIVGSEPTRPTVHTLANIRHDQPIFSCGDAEKTFPTLNPSNDNNLHNTEAKKIVKQHEIRDVTLPKESVKSDDDFDVNEYFARLQGTRYVSAPIHSNIKEDQSADAEENLEEINLNEPDKPQVDAQQSFTADIAQNFSQLPTVLPHVASAVFSSFSNMLSLKGREQTPNSSKPMSGYREVETQHLESTTTVPLMGVEESVRNIGPPPKEPPIGGSGKYRITSKKKYAQVPGLTCGDTGPNIYSVPLNPNTPLSFTPTHIERDKIPVKEDTNIDEQNLTRLDPAYTVPEILPDSTNFENTQNVIEKSGYINPVGAILKDANIEGKEVTYNIFNPAEVYIQNTSGLSQSQATIKMQQDFGANTNINESDVDESYSNPIPTHDMNAPLDSVPVVPPPPMFSNTPRDKPPVGKSILPPSVARRISAKQPIIKPQSVTPMVVENIFVPILDHDTIDLPSTTKDFKEAPESMQSIHEIDLLPKNNLPHQPSQFATSSIPATSVFYNPASDVQPPLVQRPPASDISICKPVKPDLNMSTLNMQQSKSTSISSSVPKHDDISNIGSLFASKKEIEKPFLPPSACAPDQSNFRLPLPLSSLSRLPTNKETSATAMFDIIQTPFSVPLSTSITEANMHPPVISQPQSSVQSVLYDHTQIQRKSKKIEQADQAQSPIKFFDPSTLLSEASLPITEPPRSSNSFNYRMTKKKPQYYSGPISGVGSISNNFKPVMPAVGSDSFKGALFTPEQQSVDSTNMDNILMPFDISKSTQTAPVPLDISKVHIQPEYNTSFDMSRQTSDVEIPKQEFKGFGIIGSLKSKLSSIDIHKIQNSVTTFFDPAYNDLKNKTTNWQEDVPFYQQNTYDQISQNRMTSFEVFVPNVEYTSLSRDGQILEDVSHSYHNTNENRNPFNYYQNQEQGNLPASSYFAYSNNSITMQPTHTTTSVSFDPLSGFTYTEMCKEDITKGIDKVVPKEGSFVKIVSLPGIVDSNTYADNFSQNQQSRDEHGDLPQMCKDKTIDKNVLKAGSFVKIVSLPGIGDSDTYADDFTHNQQSSDEHGDLPQMCKYTEFENETLSKPIQEFTQNVKVSSDISGIKLFDTPLPENKTFDTSGIIQQGSSKLRPIDDCCTVENIHNTKTNVFEPQKESFSVPTLDIAKQDKLLKKVFDTEEKNKQVVSENKLDSIPLFHNILTNIVDVDPFVYIKPEHQEPQLPCRTHPEIHIRETNLLESLSTDEIPIVAVSSVPLFGLSTIIPEKSKETLLSESKKPESSLPKPERPYDKKAIARFFENIPPREIIKPQEIKVSRELQKVEFKIPKRQEADTESDLNICETCREVNKHEGRETEDLTTQLIENITAPIQLSNPVEAPFTEGETTQTRVEFDRDQFEKISHITEDTIGSIHMHSATELLDNVPMVNPRGRANNVWQVDGSTTEDDNDFKFAPKPPSGVFYENNSQFFEKVLHNVIEDIKTEFNINNDGKEVNAGESTSAPIHILPTENDSRSEVAGNIDVNSIELDANRDFPVYVIEPSSSEEDSTDFKEIEKFKETGIKMESFTNRIERFKKREETKVDNPEIYRTKLSSVNSPSIPIASYFDTGNYAAETHYKNYLYSSSSGNYMGSPSQPMRIPPGFEDEYQRRMSGLSNSQVASYLDLHGKSDEPVVHETSTQSSTAVTVDSKDIDDDFDVQSHLTNCIDESDIQLPPQTKPNKPVLAKMFGTRSEDEDDVDYDDTRARNGSDDMSPSEPPIMYGSVQVDFVDRRSDSEDYKRLASYFDSPTNTEHSKSFFELSQSENHYRHNSNENQTRHDNNENQIRNIDNDNYVANLNLMKDLTSVDNIQPSKEQTDKILHYFTFEYDREIETIRNERNNKLYNVNYKVKLDETKENDLDENIDKLAFPFKTESNCETFSNETKFDNNIDEILKSNSNESDNDKFYTDVNKCDICCSYLNINEGNYKFRKFVNDSAGSNKEVNSSMAQGIEDPRRSVTVNFDTYSLQDDANDGVTVLNENRTTSEYTQVKHHWFYRVDVDDKSIWRGFSVVDSNALEDAYLSENLNEGTVVPTDGGRYDVYVTGRIRKPVYWNDKPTNVRRCSWFFKGTTDARYVPYSENVAEKLEEEYRHGITTGEWHRQLILPNNELVVMHGPSVMVHFLHGGAADTFSTSPLFPFGKRVYRNPPKIRLAKDQPENIDHLILLVHGAGEYRSQKEKTQSTSRPRVVRRGHDESEIEDTEPSSIDHILLLCHGVGSVCDMRFRNVEEVVNDFRATSLQLVQSHYRNSYENGVVSRVEVLPISWHSTLHSGENGVDRRLAQITLDSIPRLRNFTNDTVLDVLFYTSPVYCQTIIDTVCNELNRIYSLFLQRNPGFTGGVSLGGHSLGSVILYDLLCHQESESKEGSAEKSFVNKSAGGCNNQPSLNYPKLIFNPAALYALGSPIAIFECIRGVESLGMEFALPTCSSFFNIFHPYDPIAYRIEPLINPQLRNVKPFLVPHHKGRKRMHLELKDTMVRVGTDLKQKFIESIRTTWNKWKAQTPTDGQLEKVVEEEIEKEQLNEERKQESAQNETASPDMLGKLNGGRRVDYVLQEAPLEVINEYLFAMSSHVGYWESEDTMLLMLREIYDALGVQPDSTIPQQNMTVQRTRALVQDETIVIDQPTTSRGGGL